MAYALQSKAAATSWYNTAGTPAMPATYSTGNLLVLRSASYTGGTTTLPTISGYTLASTQAGGSIVNAIWLRLATGSGGSSGADQPSINWGNQFQAGQVTAYSGNPATLTGIVHAAIDSQHNLASGNAPGCSVPALTITQPNCLVLMAGYCFKTATSNSNTWNSYGSFAVRDQIWVAGSAFTQVLDEWIQTTATNVSSGTQTSSSATESFVMDGQCAVIALLPATTTTLTFAAAGGAYTYSGGDLLYPNAPIYVQPGAYDYIGGLAFSNYEIDVATGAYAYTGQGATFPAAGGAVTAFPSAGAYNYSAGPATQFVAPTQAYPRLVLDPVGIPYWVFIDQNGAIFYVPAGNTTKAIQIPTTASPFIWLNNTGNFANVVLAGGLISDLSLLGLVPNNSGPYEWVIPPSGTIKISLQSQIGTAITVPPGVKMQVTYTLAPAIYRLQ
jgi:hypothetical protein